MNGKVTNKVAITKAGTVKINCKPYLASQEPSNESIPKIDRKINPEIIGEIENGKSIKLIKKLLP